MTDLGLTRKIARASNNELPKKGGRDYRVSCARCQNNKLLKRITIIAVILFRKFTILDNHSIFYAESFVLSAFLFIFATEIPSSAVCGTVAKGFRLYGKEKESTLAFVLIVLKHNNRR
jgi:hypothetical protein